MCIILYKPEGVELPGTRVLHNCWSNNPDGAGFMYPGRDGKVHVRKGFMTFGALTEALDEDSWTDKPLVLHFRIGTQGTKGVENTHPFVVSRHNEVLGSPKARGEVALAHNGIIPLTAYGYSKDDDLRYSDTYLFVRDYVALAIPSPYYYKRRETIELLHRLAESKLALMSGNGHVELCGSFEYDKKGTRCWYSNNAFRYERKVISKHYDFKLKKFVEDIEIPDETEAKDEDWEDIMLAKWEQEFGRF